MLAIFIISLLVFLPCLILGNSKGSSLLLSAALVSMLFVTGSGIYGGWAILERMDYNERKARLERPELFKRSLEVHSWNRQVAQVKANPWLYKWTVWDGAEYVVEEGK